MFTANRTNSSVNTQVNSSEITFTVRSTTDGIHATRVTERSVFCGAVWFRHSFRPPLQEMIRVGKIHRLGVHFHRSKRDDNRTLDTLNVDMKQIRLHHYLARTRADGIERARKWKKSRSRMGVIESNGYFTMIFDDTITDSKRLL